MKKKKSSLISAVVAGAVLLSTIMAPVVSYAATATVFPSVSEIEGVSPTQLDLSSSPASSINFLAVSQDGSKYYQYLSPNFAEFDMATGAQLRIVGSVPSYVKYAKLNEDGTKIAYATETAVYVADLTPSTPAVTTVKTVSGSTFFGSENHLAIRGDLLSYLVVNNSTGSGLYIYNMATKSAVATVESATGALGYGQSDFSLDGKHLYYQKYSGPETIIWDYTISSGTKTELGRFTPASIMGNAYTKILVTPENEIIAQSTSGDENRKIDPVAKTVEKDYKYPALGTASVVFRGNTALWGDKIVDTKTGKSIKVQQYGSPSLTTYGLSGDGKYVFAVLNSTGQTKVALKYDVVQVLNALQTPKAPTLVSVIPPSNNYTTIASISFSLVPEASYYEVLRNGEVIKRLDGSGYTLSGKTATVKDNNVPYNSTLEYSVRAVNAEGSAVSDSLSITTVDNTALLGNKVTTKGSKVRFAGVNWFVIGDNLLLQEIPVATRVQFETTLTNSGKYDTTATTNVGSSLLNWLKTNMSADEGTVIDIAPTNVVQVDTNKQMYVDKSKIRLMTVEEYNGLTFSLGTDSDGIWLMNPYTDLTTRPTSAAINIAYGSVRMDAVKSDASTYYKQSRGVIKLVDGLPFSGEGTTFDPFTIEEYTAGDSQSKKPTNFKATNVKSNSISLSVDPQSDTTFTFKRNDVVVYSGVNNTYVDTKLSPSTTYTYTVTAKTGESAESQPATLTVKTLAEPAVTPEDFKVDTKDATSVRLSWTNNGSDVYVVSRNGAVVYSNTQSFFEDTNLDPNTTYTYVLTSKKGTQVSAPTTLEVTTDQETVSAPTGFTVAHVSYDSIDLSWHAVSNATTYTLKQDGEEVYSGSATAFSSTGLVEGTTYAFELTAHKDALVSPTATLEATTKLEKDFAPSIPAESDIDFKATVVTADSVHLSWNELESATSYIVKRDNLTIYEGSDLSFVDTDVAPDTSYTYSLQGVNAHGEGNSVNVSVHTDGVAPQAPQGFKASRVSYDFASLQWGKVQGATSYQVYRDGDVLVYEGALTAFKDVTLAPLTDYSYTVIATNKWGESSPVSLDVKTTDEPVSIVISPSQPAEGTISWTFKTIPEVKDYYVERNPQWHYTEVSEGIFHVDYFNATTGVSEDLGNVNVEDGNLPFVETGVDAGKDYHYNIVAVVKDADGTETVVGTTPVEVTTPVDGSGTTVPDGGNAGGSGNGSTDGSGDGSGATDGSGNGSSDGSNGSTDGSNGSTGGSGDGSSDGSNGSTDGSGSGSNGSTDGSENGSNSSGNGTGNGSDGSVTPAPTPTPAPNTGSTGGSSGVGNVPTPDPSKGTTGVVVTNPSSSEPTKAPEIAQVGFKDAIPSFAKDAINSLVSIGVVKGYEDNTFRPNAEITRAEFAIMVKRALGLSESVFGVSKFKDFDVSAWYSVELSTALSQGITKGFTDGTYRPHALITREQAAVMISNVLESNGYKESEVNLSFTDANKIIAWAVPSVKTAVSAGVMSGYPDGEIKPLKNLTRAEAAVLIFNLLSKLN